MTLLGLLFLIIVIGIILAVVPIDPKMRQVAYAILALMFVLWLLGEFNIIGHSGYYHSDPVIVREPAVRVNP